MEATFYLLIWPPLCCVPNMMVAILLQARMRRQQRFLRLQHSTSRSVSTRPRLVPQQIHGAGTSQDRFSRCALHSYLIPLWNKYVCLCAELFEHAWASQTAVATAGLMLTSAALGFSARSLLDAFRDKPRESEHSIGEREAGERELSSAAGEDIWQMPEYEHSLHNEDAAGKPSSRRPTQDLQGRAVPAMDGEGAALQASNAVDADSNCAKPERIWEAAWQSLEAKPSSRAQQRRHAGERRATGWWQLLRLGSRQTPGRRRCSSPWQPAQASSSLVCICKGCQ